MNRKSRLMVILAGLFICNWAFGSASKQAEAVATGEASATAAALSTDTPAAPVDPERVLVTVNGKVLKAWQAEAMIKERAAADLAGAARFWTNIQLKSEEAQRRGLDTVKENAFILDLYRQHYLVRILDQQTAESAPAVTEEEARKYYEDNKSKYERPFRANIQHILIKEKAKADEVADKAKAEGADFNALVEEFTQAADKRRKGAINGDISRLQRELGSDISRAIMAGEKGHILGPIQGARGFEIVKINELLPPGVPPFEELKDNIMQQLSGQNKQKAVEALVTEAQAKAVIEKSEELMKLEEEAKNKVEPPPGPPPGQ